MTIDRTSSDYLSTQQIQSAVSSPNVSAWVSANAGSGKTHVLTNRVIRLLMGSEAGGETDPASILCITYTKAAASEMQGRLFRILGEWALISDDDLMVALKDRFGDALPTIELSRVRRLFARALDAPGGLRIQTIHSFCESLLRRFPVEAGLLPGFNVLDDAEVSAIYHSIGLDMVRTYDEAEWGSAFQMLLDQFADLSSIITAVTDRTIRKSAHRAEELTSRLGLGEQATVDDIKKSAIDAIAPQYLIELEEAHEELVAEYGSSARQKFHKQSAMAIRIREATQTEYPVLFDESLPLWLTAKGELPSVKTCGGNAKVRGWIPHYPEWTMATAERLYAAAQTVAASEIAHLTKAIYQVSAELGRRYNAVKGARGVVDFEDLISRTHQLLSAVDDGWIRYKLDNGISHLLLDEAQDTGEEQWAVLHQLIAQFNAQEARSHKRRTTFVVGDKKQSIYSFQGADARLFDREQSRLKNQASGRHYKDENLFLSFRSASSLLSFVDELFTGDAGEGLYGDKIDAHRAAKPELKGQVELWPLVRRPNSLVQDLWSLPVDAAGEKHPYRQLAEYIADDIEAFVQEGGLEDAKGGARRPRYGDVMILCQRRTGIFPEIVRTLSLRNIPNGGTDRVQLMEDVAVRDMQSALRFASNHDDELSLAEFLKSPLGGFSDDDLYHLAAGRGTKRLWAQLRDAQHDADVGPQARAAIARLEAAESTGRRLGPFAFLSSLLEEGTPTGWFLIRKRLGEASDDAVDELLREALDFELRSPRSLEGFLGHLEGLTSDIKKEFDTKKDAVRIMTVHGAKGLEAPIVYLADANYLGATRSHSVPLLKEGDDDGLYVRMPAKTSHQQTDLGKDYLRQRDLEEYRRKLYVAATRAEQRLIICGTESGRLSTRHATPDEAAAEKPAREASWYGLAMQAYDRMAAAVSTQPCPWREDLGIRLLGTLSHEVIKETQAESPVEMVKPDWLMSSAPSESVELVSFPSSDEKDDEGPVMSPRGTQAAHDPFARLRGTLMHQLLELLPQLPSAERAARADAWLTRRAPDIDPQTLLAWRDEVLKVLSSPQFAAVFGPHARAEVPLRGRLKGQLYAGQVDRLLVEEKQVFFIDYKTMRPPPKEAESVAPAILRQMAIYRALLQARFPDRTIKGAILWTFVPRLMPLPIDLLDKAFDASG